MCEFKTIQEHIAVDAERLFVTGNKEKWKTESVKTPMPIFYRLQSITLLFNGHYFNIDGVDVREVGQGLSEALKVRTSHFLKEM